MKIQLIKITLLNFKGIRHFSTDFQHVTNIYGDNATGKTSLFDAFTWLLFGKDSSDRKDFEVKTLDSNNQVIPKIDHEVTATLDVDGKAIELKRVFREKWTKKRGSAEAELTGNENLYYWNDVPMQQAEYQNKIKEILDEGLFKLLTNTLCFNQMKWQDRREVLMTMAGKISNEEVIGSLMASNNHADFSGLMTILNGGKSIVEYKKEIAAKKKLLKDSLEAIPTRIDEANRSMPEYVDYEALEAQKATLREGLAEVDNAMLDANKALSATHEALGKKQNELFGLKTKVQEAEYAVRNTFNNQRQVRESEIAKLQSMINEKQRTISSNTDRSSSLFVSINKLKTQKEALTAEWYKVDGEQLTFNDNQFCCPACNRELEQNDVEAKKLELTENFNRNKSQRLAKIKADGLGLKNQIEEIDNTVNTITDHTATLNTEIATLNQQLSDLQAQHSQISLNEQQELKSAIDNNTELQDLQSRINALQVEITNTPTNQVDNSALITKKQAISASIEEINRKLATKDQIGKIQQRIAQLETEEKSLAQQLADLEKTEFQIDQFNRAKMDALEARINGRFQLVKFKLFQQQINGGETECCDTLINGVPFSDANNAAKINCGLDIIRTLSQHYNIQAPVFVDNAESVVNLLPVENQVIRLVVSGAHKKLQVGETVPTNGQLELA